METTYVLTRRDPTALSMDDLYQRVWETRESLYRRLWESDVRPETHRVEERVDASADGLTLHITLVPHRLIDAV